MAEQLSYYDFLVKRQSGIGSSDIAAIVGESPFATPVSVYMSKINPVDDRKENPFTKAGKMMEGVIGQYFAENTGAIVTRPEFVIYKDKTDDFCRAAPDFMFEKGDVSLSPLECKNTIQDFSKEIQNTTFYR